MQCARITNVIIKAQQLKASLKDTRMLERATANHVNVLTALITQKTTVDLVYRSILSAAANTAAASARVMRIPCVRSVIN